ncbi:MAG: hypothetical protein RBR09_10255 [Desulfobulbaceae bacterium]|jgi:hypothetical protein|nr:hypothetical protein [Desulfobulbaceae bacterium]
MAFKRQLLAIASIVVFALLWNGLVHLFFLREADLAIVAFGRPPQERSMVLGLGITVGISALFLVSFLQWPHRGVRAGLRHGVFFGLLAGLLVDANQYLLYPLPASLALMWFAFGFVEFCIYGLIVGRIYPNEVAAQPHSADARASCG